MEKLYKGLSLHRTPLNCTRGSPCTSLGPSNPGDRLRDANEVVFGVRGETTEGGTKPQNLGILDTSPW